MLAVLLSTYNGERFLREQLDSLFLQTFSDFTLYVRDDGSSDQTISILLEYEKKYTNIVIFKNDQINRGACMSFIWLLKNVEAEYYMFCDQDDIWFPSKIELTFNAIKSEEFRSKNMPILVHTDLIVTNSNLDIICESLWKNDKTDPLKITRKYLRIVNYITGCTMLFNRIARDLAILNYKNVLMHDFWVGICVDAANGAIVTLPIPTIYYRQHSSNAIGASNKKFRFPNLQRYFHIPDFKYSKDLFKMIKSKYKMTLADYIILRVKFYLKH